MAIFLLLVSTLLSDFFFFHTEWFGYWLIFIFAFQRLIFACEGRCCSIWSGKIIEINTLGALFGLVGRWSDLIEVFEGLQNIKKVGAFFQLFFGILLSDFFHTEWLRHCLFFICWFFLLKVGVGECNLGKLSIQIRSEHFSVLALVEVISLRFLKTCKITKKLLHFFSFFFKLF